MLCLILDNKLQYLSILHSICDNNYCSQSDAAKKKTDEPSEDVVEEETKVTVYTDPTNGSAHTECINRLPILGVRLMPLLRFPGKSNNWLRQNRISQIWV